MGTRGLHNLVGDRRLRRYRCDNFELKLISMPTGDITVYAFVSDTAQTSTPLRID